MCCNHGRGQRIFVVTGSEYVNVTQESLPEIHAQNIEGKFIDDLRTSIDLANSTNGLVTLGIRPTRPETGYGYLKTGQEFTLGQCKLAYKVDCFVEKPDVERAKGFLAELWRNRPRYIQCQVTLTGMMWEPGEFVIKTKLTWSGNF